MQIFNRFNLVLVGILVLTLIIAPFSVFAQDDAVPGCTIEGSGINVRDAANGVAIGGMEAGTAYDVISQTEGTEGSDTWYEIDYNGGTGYVASWVVDSEGLDCPAPGELTFNPEDAVEVFLGERYEGSDAWTQITLDNGTFYLAIDRTANVQILNEEQELVGSGLSATDFVAESGTFYINVDISQFQGVYSLVVLGESEVCNPLSFEFAPGFDEHPFELYNPMGQYIGFISSEGNFTTEGFQSMFDARQNQLNMEIDGVIYWFTWFRVTDTTQIIRSSEDGFEFWSGTPELIETPETEGFTSVVAANQDEIYFDSETNIMYYLSDSNWFIAEDIQFEALEVPCFEPVQEVTLVVDSSQLMGQITAPMMGGESSNDCPFDVNTQITGYEISVNGQLNNVEENLFTTNVLAEVTGDYIYQITLYLADGRDPVIFEYNEFCEVFGPID